ncbi:MAG TPA: hypothetical protein VHX99_07150 [Rhizomicrobium sp.]|jgi:hypothetical protein|nr:hypothetical protein [Rhizomicrobium sp.]
MRRIAIAALMLTALATPCLAQSNPTRLAEAANLTVRDGSDAGPVSRPVLPDGVQVEDATNLADLPRIATHAPTPLGRAIPAADSQ